MKLVAARPSVGVEDSRVARARVEPIDATAFPWLLPQRIAIPDRVPGYVERAELMQRAMPTRRRLTVLHASGGFGKTTLLAECCRRLREDGIATAWVSLDDRDEPAVVDAYIALACTGAGLNLLDVADADKAPMGPGSRLGLVVREIGRFAGPFVIAFDELERLKHPDAVSILAFLLRRGPPNLHVALACREIPDGLDVAGALLAGRGDVVETEDLRFSRADAARFFDLRLSPDALAAEMSRSAGWPLAMRVSRNGMERGGGSGANTSRAFVKNWFESRLFADLEKDDRNLVLDLGLFGWFDAALLGEVLQGPESMRRVESMDALVGLFVPVTSGTTRAYRLHPLLRRHCTAQRLQEDPERFRVVHRRIAAVLAKRGDTVLAMHHAVEGSDPFLAGDLLEQAGGVRLWTLQGVPQLLEANELLADDVIAGKPRLILVRCLALALAGSPHQARQLYRERLSGRSDDERDTDFEHGVDDCIVRSGMALYGGDPLGENLLTNLLRSNALLSRSRRLDSPTRGHIEYALCVMHFLKGEFDDALERLARARGLLQGQYVPLYGEVLSGQIEFARGRPQAARSHVGRARRIASKCFLQDPVAAASCAVVMKEVALECSLAPAVAEPAGMRRVLTKHGVPFSLFATALNVLIDARLRSGRTDGALAVAEEVLAFVRGAGFTTFARLAAALRVSVLVIAGRIDGAERAWRQEGLPEGASRCVALADRSWREMEAISEARVRLLIARERFREARALLRELRTVALERGFRRIEMRASALSILLEQHAGDTDAASRHLDEYLGLFAQCPYAWPLLRERATCAAPVRRYLDEPDSPHQGAAGALLDAMERLDDDETPSLSEREADVLRLLPDHRDKAIAAALGLGVA